MEIIVLILVVVFALLNAKGKKPKADQAGAPRTAQANPKPARAMNAQERLAHREALLKQRDARLAQSVAQPTVVAPEQAAAKPVESPAEARLRKLQAVVQAATGEGAPMLADDDCHGGSMEHTHAEGNAALTDEDCAGGSMEHTHTEGVSRSEQTRKMAAIDGAPRLGDALPEVIDARALRRAVVMAEVLGRPRALRARR